MAKILLIDDEPSIRLVLKIILADHEVKEAETALDGIEMFRKFEPDLVILDILMPEINGLTCAYKLFEINSNAKILLLTGSTDISSVINQYEMLVDKSGLKIKEILNKPICKRDLLAAVNRALCSSCENFLMELPYVQLFPGV